MQSRRSLLVGGAAAAVLATVGRPSPASAAATPPALFVGAHPDDETLAMGVAIAEHVAAGQDVHLLLCTDGEASGVISTLNGTGVNVWWGVRHDPAVEGYAPLTAPSLAAARVSEARRAARCLVAGLPGTLTVHRARLGDGALNSAAVQKAVLAVANAIAPGAPVRLKGHSPIVDNHPDHLAVGQALMALSAADPARFSDRRHYILPAYWSDPRLAQVAESWDNPTDSGIKARARNAIRSYGAWAPEAGSYAIGWHSVSGMLVTLDRAPKCLQHS